MARFMSGGGAHRIDNRKHADTAVVQAKSIEVGRLSWRGQSPEIGGPETV